MTDFLDQARSALQRGDIQKAEALCVSALQDNPANDEIYHFRGFAFLQGGRMDDAFQDFSQALSLKPDDPRYLTSLAFWHKLQGDVDRAEDLFRKAIRTKPDTMQARYQLGNLMLEKHLATPGRWQDQFRKLSVVIPSRLEKHPLTGQLWLDRSTRSVLEQSVAGQLDIEIVVGVDPGAQPPDHLAQNPRIKFAEAIPEKRKGQAAAINSAMAAATGDIVTMIEDDDFWHSDRLETGLKLLTYYDFVSCNQMEILPDNKIEGLNDFPTPCGWLMRRQVWDEIGPMDEDFPCHLDTEWLGRLNQAGKMRCHIVEATVPVAFDQIVKHRHNLLTLIRWMPEGSGIYRSHENRPLIMRTIHPGSGMARIKTDPALKAQSEKEHALMKERYGYFPW